MSIIPSKGTSVQVSRIFSDLISPELKRVESEIRAQVAAFDSGLEEYMGYICGTSGKRLRPMLAILVGGACGGISDGHVKIGVILELIHMATLVHDDIIDDAKKRRKNLTPNAKWGNSMAVLLGDALFSHALTMATDFGDISICRKIGKASNDVCQGEVIQTQRRFDPNLTEEEYLRIVGMKTGALFSEACGLSAYLSKMPEETQSQLWDFGMKLGTAYQIYDDCLDITGNEAEIGKTLRTDMEKGKLTLPILRFLANAEPAQRKIFCKQIKAEKLPDFCNGVGMARELAKALSESVQKAESLTEEARSCLAVLPESEFSKALVGITKYLDDLLAKCRPA